MGMGDAGVGVNIIPRWDYMTWGINEWSMPIGERDNSVYGLRAGSQVWKGEDGKGKTQ